ncbi:MAG: c-type cytochrome [Alphaproteobacteria bacterium]
MNFKFVWVGCLVIWGMVLPGRAALGQQSDLVKKGEYLTIAGGCVSCHTDFKKKGQPFAGGAPIPTPFGTFFPPNITPSKQHGIGNWSDADFIRAMREGINPEGAHYFPAFPYTSYTRITEPDLKAMKAYLFSLKPVELASTPHDISFPFSWRFLQTGWKLLFFREGEFEPGPGRSSEVNRGAYLANALAHCGECHTPRNRLGGLDYDSWMAGTPNGPENEKIPNITPDSETGLSWTVPEIVAYLKTGSTPDFDFAGSMMADVIAHNTGKLTDADLKAIAEYLKSLPPIRNAF